MIIVSIADLHLNLSVYNSILDKTDFPTLPFKSADFMRAFKWNIDTIIKMDPKPDLVAINGDVYDSPMPSNQIRGFFSDQIARLSSMGIRCAILIGNHDVYKNTHALEDINKLKLDLVNVYDQPAFSKIGDHALLFFPYSLEIERKLLSPKESFNKFINSCKDEISKDDVKHVILFAHSGIKSGKINEYHDVAADIEGVEEETKKEFLNTNPNDISPKDLDRSGAEYVLLGDYHQFQVINGTKKCKAIYSGAIERIHALEKDHKKGFVVYNSDAEEDQILGKCRFIEYPNCRSMLVLKGTLPEMKQKLERFDEKDYQNSIVSITFIGDHTELIDFSIGLEAFQNDIRKRFNPIHIVQAQKIKNNKIVIKEDQTTESKMVDREHFEKIDILDIIKELINDHVDEEDKAKDTLAIAVEIYNEVVGE